MNAIAKSEDLNSWKYLIIENFQVSNI